LNVLSLYFIANLSLVSADVSYPFIVLNGALAKLLLYKNVMLLCSCLLSLFY